MDPIVLADLLLASRGRLEEAARRVLTWALEHQRGRSIALWRAEKDEILLECGISLDHESIRAANDAWAANREELLAGRPVSLGNSAFVPTRTENYFVFIDGSERQGVRSFDLALTSTMGGVAARAIRSAKLPPDLPSKGEDAALEIVAALEQHEWNIARVARAKGVTRKTVYDWMRKYQIPRRRVKKS
jgi:hypothetical protein